VRGGAEQLPGGLVILVGGLGQWTAVTSLDDTAGRGQEVRGGPRSVSGSGRVTACTGGDLLGRSGGRGTGPLPDPQPLARGEAEAVRRTRTVLVLRGLVAAAAAESTGHRSVITGTGGRGRPATLQARQREIGRQLAPAEEDRLTGAVILVGQRHRIAGDLARVHGAEALAH